MTFDLGKALSGNCEPLDIEHATKDEILEYRMIGLSPDEEKRMYKRSEELGLYVPESKRQY